jgi:hypothetical protein
MGAEKMRRFARFLSGQSLVFGIAVLALDDGDSQLPPQPPRAIHPAKRTKAIKKAHGMVASF